MYTQWYESAQLCRPRGSGHHCPDASGRFTGTSLAIGPNVQPVQYPDRDVVALAPKFRRYMIGNTAMRRLYVSTSGRRPGVERRRIFLVWSDIPSNTQLRWIEDDSRVTTFRNLAGYSNGNTFD